MKPLTAIITLLAIVGVAWYFFFTIPAPAPTSPAAPLGITQTPAGGPLDAPRSAPEGYKEYRNETYRFAFFYPSSYAIKEFDEGKGAITVTVENAQEARGFQVFVVPYAGEKVTGERFAQDVPSGVLKDYKDIALDGVAVGTFISSNAVFGETREVWAIRGGYLYEVSTPKMLDEWFSTMLETWQFI